MDVRKANELSDLPFYHKTCGLNLFNLLKISFILNNFIIIYLKGKYLEYWKDICLKENIWALVSDQNFSIKESNTIKYLGILLEDNSFGVVLFH